MPIAGVSPQQKHQPRKLGVCDPLLGRTKKGIPARYVLAVLTFLGMAHLFAMIVIMNVSIVAMVDNMDVVTTDQTMNGTACVELMPNATNQPVWSEKLVYRRRGNYKWDSKTQSIILSSFYYGFTASLIPGGVLAQRFGGKWTFSLAVLFTSILTLLTPQAADWGVVTLVLVRALEGLVQGVVFPARNVLVSHWIPLAERSRFITCSMNGTFIGSMVGILLGGVLADLDFLDGWPATFYFFGLCGCLWFVFWAFFVYEDPSFHPRISEAELNLIQMGLTTNTSTSSHIPWLSILESIPVWALNIAIMGISWASAVLSMEMPTYLSNILHFNMKMNGLLSSLPYALQAIASSVAGHVMDKLTESGKFTLTTVRKLMNSIAFYSCSICILLVAYVGCKAGVSVGLLALAYAFRGIGICVCATITVDMSPSYTAPLTGIVYTLFSAPASLAPYAVGQIISSGQTMENWNRVFFITAAISFSAATIFNIFGSAEVQPWGSDCPDNKPSCAESQQVTSSTREDMNNRNEITKF